MDYESDASDNASKIESELQNLGNYHSQRSYGEFWRTSSEILDMFKTLKPLTKGDRDKLWDRYIRLKDTVKQESSASASRLEQEIESLASSHLMGLGIPSLSDYNYSEFWPHAKLVAQQFKESSLFKGDRERLWGKYQDLCGKVRRQQDQRRFVSNSNRKTIEEIITNAHYTIGSASSKEELQRAKELQEQALQRMKELNLVKQDREACWNYRQQVYQELFHKRQELQGDNFARARGLANECLSVSSSYDPYDVLERIKGTRSQIKGSYMHKDHWEEVNSTLNHAWETAISRIEQSKEEKRRKHEEYERKHEDWLRRCEGNIDRWEGNIGKAEDTISRIQGQISDLEYMVSDAKTDDFAYKVQGWISEKEDVIRDIESNISDWESKISDVRSKMRE